MKFCKLRVIFQTYNRLRNYFHFKDSVPETLQSDLIYKFSCGSCTASYIGKTYRHFKVRVSEHQGVFPRTGKPVKGILSTSLRDLILVCDHKVVHEASSRYILELKESLFIKRDRPSIKIISVAKLDKRNYPIWNTQNSNNFCEYKFLLK